MISCWGGAIEWEATRIAWIDPLMRQGQIDMGRAWCSSMHAPRLKGSLTARGATPARCYVQHFLSSGSDCSRLGLDLFGPFGTLAASFGVVVSKQTQRDTCNNDLFIHESMAQKARSIELAKGPLNYEQNKRVDDSDTSGFRSFQHGPSLTPDKTFLTSPISEVRAEQHSSGETNIGLFLTNPLST